MNRWKAAFGAGEPGVFFLSAVSAVLLVCVFLIVMPFSLVASALGPQWVLLANVMLDGVVIAFAVSLPVWSRLSRRRGDLGRQLAAASITGR
jgi:fumarate reductase subunit D